MFLSWTKFHGRSADLASALGMEAVFIDTRAFRGNIGRRYGSALLETRRILRAQKPQVLVVMLPPAPLLLAALVFRAKGTELLADAHTGFFLNPKWKWFTRVGLWLLRKSTVLVTNDALASISRTAGVRTVVIHDLLSDGDELARDAAAPAFVLCPVSYANDEPISELLAAAALCPDLTFYFTGSAPTYVSDAATINVRFTGYVDDDHYRALVRDCSAIAALTKRDLTMQRAGYEALMARKPQITSKFGVLEDFLQDAAEYADPNDPSSIASGLHKLIAYPKKYSLAANRVLHLRLSDQKHALNELEQLTTRSRTI